MLEINKPIIIQGAMEMEVDELFKFMNVEKEENVNGCKFYIGQVNEYPVIISKTEIGIINASIAN